MAKNYVLMLAGILSLSSCNFYGGIDKPSGDEQLLNAARGCFDRGDYACATEFYQKYAGDADTKISELVFLSLAQSGIFSMSDFIATLGSGRGGGQSLAAVANLNASRGNTSGAIRTNLQVLYANASTISNASLKGYTQFVVSFAMMAQVLASVVGPDGILTAGDLSLAASCKTGACASNANCDPTGSLLLTDVAASDTGITMNASTNWSGAPSIEKVMAAANAANNALTTMGVSNFSGVFAAINQLSGFGALAERCKRQTLETILFP